MVKYYSEDQARAMRLPFEKEVMKWSGVIRKTMFGCPCYKAKDKLFSFPVTDGAVITNRARSKEHTINITVAT